MVHRIVNFGPLCHMVIIAPRAPSLRHVLVSQIPARDLGTRLNFSADMRMRSRITRNMNVNPLHAHMQYKRYPIRIYLTRMLIDGSSLSAVYKVRGGNMNGP